MKKPTREDFRYQVVDQNNVEIGRRLDEWEYMEALENYINYLEKKSNHDENLDTNTIKE